MGRTPEEIGEEVGRFAQELIDRNPGMVSVTIEEPGRANAYRKRKAGRELTTELELPSGAVFTVRRPPLQVWIAAGRVPQSFLTKVMNPQNANEAQFNDEEILASIVFIREALTYACVSPKLVIDAKGEDELDPGELDPEDFEFLSRWVLSGSPGVAVKTKGGEVSTDDLSRFRQKRAGGKPFSIEPDSGEVPMQAEPAFKNPRPRRRSGLR